MEPYLSVHIATYNQKDFISNAIESALAQKITFPIEIVIGDDHSTDGTREILKEFKRKYPDRILLNLLPSKGKGMIGNENYETTMEKCRGKYIAFLDGDDYWMDKDKLSKQVLFLESNTEFVMCHHDCEANETEGVLLKKKFNKNKPITGFYDACQITIPFMSSVVIRRDAINFYNRRSYLDDLDLGDFALWIMASLKGKFYYFDEVMAYYRVNRESVSKTLGYEVQVRNRMIFAEKLLKSEYHFDRNFMYSFVSRYYFQFSGISLSKRQFGNTFKYLFKSLLFLGLGISLNKKNYLWISRLKWTRLFQLYAANIPAALKTN
jgi:glycosyltransferase involved in cell wall biosynthesis